MIKWYITYGIVAVIALSVAGCYAADDQFLEALIIVLMASGAIWVSSSNLDDQEDLLSS